MNLKALALTTLSALTVGAAPAMANTWIQSDDWSGMNNGYPVSVRVSFGTEWDRAAYTIHMDGRYYQVNVWAKCSGGRYTEWTTDGADASELTHSDAADLAAELCVSSGTTGRF